MDKRKTLITGSFDPPTRGHEDIIRRLCETFDEVRAVAFINAQKAGFFPPEYRLSLLRQVCAPFPNAHADAAEGYVADYVLREGIDLIVRGVRGEEDIAYEMQMADFNRKAAGVETFFVNALPGFEHFSSSEVRRRLLSGEDVRALLPEVITEEIMQNWQKNRISPR